MRAHGINRQTTDLDLWVSRSNGNARRISSAFSRFRATSPQGEEWTDAFMRPNRRFPYPEDGERKEVDILNTIRGADFGECFGRSVEIELGGISVPCVGLEDLIMLKRVSAGSGNDEAAHERDVADIEALTAMLHTRTRTGDG